MVRLFGRSFGSKSRPSQSLQPSSSSSKRTTKQKRLTPSARTPQGRREHHPMFQYAMDEYAQTVVPQKNNDPVDDYHDDDDDEHDYEGQQTQAGDSSSLPLQPSGSTDLPPTRGPDQRRPHARTSSNSSFCYYEESFGPAYTGGILTYIYPSGYQSMRPRSAPWKLSIVVFCLFTWLSVFIVGHCSDMSAAYQQAQQDTAADGTTAYDDLVDNYNARWCGSRPLYWLWVASMLITGFSASYCSIIGYIKVRDFAVANVRSQPCASVGDSSLCGVVKSDYYVRIQNATNGNGVGPYGYGYGSHRHGSVVGSTADQSQGSGSVSTNFQYHPSIYQSDGTPQFWGAHIYRPTQAAVAVTSR